MMGPFRNHPIVLVKTSLIALLMLIIMLCADSILIMISAAAIIAVVVFIIVRVWYMTVYTFGDSEIIVSKTTLFKADRTIPYSKISSVNTVRSIWDRIAGTESIKVNINSGVNATVPEITLVLKRALSSELYQFLSEMIHGPVSDDAAEECTEEIQRITFTDFDTIRHGLLCNPTASLIASALFLAYSIFDLSRADGGTLSGILSVLIFALNLLLPMLVQIIRNFDFSVYREGNTIYLEHGLFTKYHSSFEVGRINAVCIRQPLVARLFGLSAVQAEVVGINAVASDATPTLCLMTTDRKLRMIMEQIVPEFDYDSEIIRQPPEAKAPVFIKSVLASTISIIAAIVIIIVMNALDIDSSTRYIVITLSIVSAVLLTMIFLVCGYKSLKNKGICFGDDLFTMIDGVVDRTITVMYYDRVQMTEVGQGPLARHFGLSNCTVYFLSSMGNVGSASVGYLSSDTASVIGDILMKRLDDGSYDHRINEI